MTCPTRLRLLPALHDDPEPELNIWEVASRLRELASDIETRGGTFTDRAFLACDLMRWADELTREGREKIALEIRRPWWEGLFR